jgi:rSAM-partnered protein
MVEKTDRKRVGGHPREDTHREWEVFVRDETSDPVRHVGSITAPDLDTAYEQSTKLFAWFVEDVWLCPAEAMGRFSTHDLDAEATDATIETGVEPRAFE